VSPRAKPSPDDALRSNGLFAVSLGLVTGERAKRCIEAAQKYLVVPGALRSLAPLPVSVPLPIWRDGQLLNTPSSPIARIYEGDEDTRRKPAYQQRHGVDVDVSGFFARRWRCARGNFSPAAVAGGQGISRQHGTIAERGLSRPDSGKYWMATRRHAQRGCDAQAWGRELKPCGSGNGWGE